jgi:hypothetical protein
MPVFIIATVKVLSEIMPKVSWLPGAKRGKV